MDDATALVQGLEDLFKNVEIVGLRVGSVWLHPMQARTLLRMRQGPLDAHVARLPTSGQIGFLFGAVVHESVNVPLNHAAVIPDGLHVTQVESEACQRIPGTVPKFAVSAEDRQPRPWWERLDI